MSGIQKLRKHGTSIVCWTVKGVGTALLLLVVAIAVGEGPPNPFELTTVESVQMANFLIALLGLVLALWQQGIGGIITIIGIFLFCVVQSIYHGRLSTGGFFFIVIGLVGVSNILCWWLRRKFLKSGLDAVRDPMEKVSKSLDEVGKNK